MEVQTSGAASDADARAISKSVVASSLVKAAVYGHDPNWGRIACAAGWASHSASSLCCPKVHLLIRAVDFAALVEEADVCVPFFCAYKTAPAQPAVTPPIQHPCSIASSWGLDLVIEVCFVAAATQERPLTPTP